MSKRNYIDEFEYLASDGSIVVNRGMDSTTPIQGLRPGYVRSALNCHPGLVTGWEKRSGASNVLSSVWTGYSVTGGIEYKNSGARSIVVFGTNGSVGTLGVATTSVSNIVSSLSSTARPSFVQLGDLLLFVNGADTPLIYDGAVTRQVGITAPASAATSSFSGSGSLTTNSNYIWAYTYYNSVTGAESSPATLTSGATGANTKNTLTLVAGTSTTADTIRVYRTVASGNTLFLEGTAAISATSFISQAADSALLSTQLELDNTRITTWSGTPAYPLLNDSRVFLRTGRNELRHSKYGQSGPMYESFEAGSFVDTSGSYGSADDIIGTAKAGTIGIVLKERSIGMLEPIGIPSLNAVSDPIRYQYRELSNTVDPVGHFAALEVNGECVFLTRSNVYGTRGQQGDLRQLADSMQATIKAFGFNSTQIPYVSAINDTKNQRILFSVFGSSSETIPRYQLVGDYRLYPDFRWSLYRPGTNTTTHPGWRAGCFISVTSTTDGSQDILFGNSELNGQIYKANDGTSDPGTTGIYWEIVSRPYACRTIAQTKLFQKAPVYVAGSGASYSLSVSTIYDMSGEEEALRTISLSSGGAAWDTAVWDVDVFASNSSPLRPYRSHRKAVHQQLVFRQTEAAAPVTLYGWGVSGSRFNVF